MIPDVVLLAGVAVSLLGWFVTWRDSRRKDKIDPMSAAGNLTVEMAKSMEEVLAPLRREVKILRLEVRILRELLERNGIAPPDISFLEQINDEMGTS